MKRLLLSLLLSAVLPVFAQAQPAPISADKAFQFTATANDHQTIVGLWRIEPGYFLYKDRIFFSPAKPEQNKLGQPLLPNTNITKDYPGVGKLSVYTDHLQIAVPVIKSSGPTLVVKVRYQGCSEAGYCYPPQTKIVPINLAGNYGVPVQPVDIDLFPAAAPSTAPISEQDNITQLLQNHGLLSILIGFFGFGLLLSLTPCVLPMIPILSGIIVGKGDHISHAHAFGLSLAYVLGMAITYAAAGVMVGLIGGSVQSLFQQTWIIILFSLLFVAMALSLFGFYNIQVPEKLRSRLATMSNHQKRGSYVGASIMGCLSTLILSPCVTPPLVGALAYISQSGNATIGGLALFVMGLGMGVPLLLIGAFSVKLLPNVGVWMNAIKYILGVLMLAVAVWMMSRIIPGPIAMALWAMLALGSAIAMGALSTAISRRQKFTKIIGIALFVYGIVLAIGAFLGNSNPLSPIDLSSTRKVQTPQGDSRFITVQTVSDVNKQLTMAITNHQPAMLDFYADWCISCKEMERYTFGNPSVQQELAHYRLLRADVSKNDLDARQLQQYFGVVAPPTILFFGSDGKEIKNSRVIGEMSAEKFTSHLRVVKQQLRL